MSRWEEGSKNDSMKSYDMLLDLAVNELYPPEDDDQDATADDPPDEVA